MAALTALSGGAALTALSGGAAFAQERGAPGRRSAPSAPNVNLGRAGIVLPATSGQQALAVRVESGALLARVCPAGSCAEGGGKPLEVPSEVAPHLARARITEVVLPAGKHVARIDVPGLGAESAERRSVAPGGNPGGTSTWVMLLAAPLAGKGAEPIVLWSGRTGLSKGNEYGEARSYAVVEEPEGNGTRLLVGERREDVTMCGRPTLVAAREVDPATMTLVKGASVQNLSAAERAGALKLTARRREENQAPGFRLLRPTAASSAVGKRFAEIADGDPRTAWSEARSGAGRGEFVSFSSAPEVGITGLSLKIKPSGELPPGGAAPRRLYLATPDRLFDVSIPEDAWAKEGAGYDVQLPEPVQTTCLALVLDEAHAPLGQGDPRVTIAELTARTELDGQSVQALVGALAGGGERARAAAALLARGGADAVAAAVAGYEKLDAAGRQLAAGVIDTGPCSAQVPFLAARLAALSAGGSPRDRRAPDATSEDPELHHARDRIRRCGRAAAPALAEVVRSGADAAKIAAAYEMALVAPTEAIPVLLDALAGAVDATRRELRTALSQAARSERAADAVEAELELARLRARPEVAQLDFLRALVPVLGRVQGGAAAFQALAASGGSAPFRTRFLLQTAAAALARGGEGAAETYLRAALRQDAVAHVRARAAEVAAAVPALLPDLLAATADAEVRVREAAVGALARAAADGAKLPKEAPGALAGLLVKDPWTFIRSGAARAIGGMGATPVADQALAGALSDASSEVRSHALDALGAHRAIAHLAAVRDRAEDTEEDVEVRARAILALASMCDRGSLDEWTKLARRAKAPLGELDHRLGTASLAALGMVHPADLRERLRPLLEKDTPPGLREAAKAAIDATSQCR